MEKQLEFNFNKSKKKHLCPNCVESCYITDRIITDCKDYLQRRTSKKGK